MQFCQELCNLTREINRLRQQQHRQNQRRRDGGLRPQERAAAVAIYILAGHSAETAAEFCAQLKPEQDHDWKTAVEDWVLDCSVDQMVAYEMPETPADCRVHHIAEKWLAERTTALWVRDQNYAQGVAPSSSAMVDKYVALIGQERAGAVGWADRSSRRFCQHLRARWHMRLGTLKTREPMGDDVIRKKD